MGEISATMCAFLRLYLATVTVGYVSATCADVANDCSFSGDSSLLQSTCANQVNHRLTCAAPSLNRMADQVEFFEQIACVDREWYGTSCDGKATFLGAHVDARCSVPCGGPKCEAGLRPQLDQVTTASCFDGKETRTCEQGDISIQTESGTVEYSKAVCVADGKWLGFNCDGSVKLITDTLNATCPGDTSTTTDWTSEDPDSTATIEPSTIVPECPGKCADDLITKAMESPSYSKPFDGDTKDATCEMRTFTCLGGQSSIVINSNMGEWGDGSDGVVDGVTTLSVTCNAAAATPRWEFMGVEVTKVDCTAVPSPQCPALGTCTQAQIDARWEPGYTHGSATVTPSGATCSGTTPQFVFAKGTEGLIIANSFKCINGEWFSETCFMGPCSTASLMSVAAVVTTDVCCMSETKATTVAPTTAPKPCPLLEVIPENVFTGISAYKPATITPTGAFCEPADNLDFMLVTNKTGTPTVRVSLELECRDGEWWEIWFFPLPAQKLIDATGMDWTMVACIKS